MKIRWYLSGVAAAALVGWIAAKCHLSGWAPVGLLSLGIGGMLGLVVAKLSQLEGIHSRRRLVIGTVIFALVVVLSEHTWLYRDFRRQWWEVRAREPHVSIFRPAEPWCLVDYAKFECSAERLTLWFVDGTLIVASAVGVVLLKRGAKTKNFVVADDANRPSPPNPVS